MAREEEAEERAAEGEGGEEVLKGDIGADRVEQRGEEEQNCREQCSEERADECSADSKERRDWS